MSQNTQLVEPLIGETWVVDGKATNIRPQAVNALYITPLVHQMGVAPSELRILHSVLVDNNVLTDMLENRRPSDLKYLTELFRSMPLEFNPVMALIEKRQNYAGASQSVHDLAELFGRTFGSWEAKSNAVEFDKILEQGKPEIATNVELLSGYIPAITYLYHQRGSAEGKLEWLGGLVRENDLPYLQIPFYLAALFFLIKDKPQLFPQAVVSKVTKDTKLQSNVELQKKAALNITHDVMLPATALFSAGLTDTFVVPYIATRDYLLQELLGQIRCEVIVTMADGRANGAWQLNPNGQLHAQLANVISSHMPRRTSPSLEHEMSGRRARLRAFSDSYLDKCLELRSARLA